MILARHYGSAFTMAEYTSETHGAYVNITFLPTNKLVFTGTFSFNKSIGELEEVNFPDLTSVLEGDLTHQDFTFDKMHTYSNLDYAIIRAGMGVLYKFSDRLSWTGDFEFGNLDDKAGYVYGDETGSFMMVRSGISYSM